MIYRDTIFFFVITKLLRILSKFLQNSNIGLVTFCYQLNLWDYIE